MKTFAKTLLAISISGLVACGGGGGASTPTPVKAAAPAPSATATPTTTTTTTTTTVTTPAPVVATPDPITCTAPEVANAAGDACFLPAPMAEEATLVELDPRGLEGMCDAYPGETNVSVSPWIIVRDFNGDGVKDFGVSYFCELLGTDMQERTDLPNPQGRFMVYVSENDTWVNGTEELFGVPGVQTTGQMTFIDTGEYVDFNGDGYEDFAVSFSPEDGRNVHTNSHNSLHGVLQSTGGGQYELIQYGDLGWSQYSFPLGKVADGDHRIMALSFSTIAEQPCTRSVFAFSYDGAGNFNDLSCETIDNHASLEMAAGNLNKYGEYLVGDTEIHEGDKWGRSPGLWKYDNITGNITFQGGFVFEHVTQVWFEGWEGSRTTRGITRMPSGELAVIEATELSGMIPEGAIGNENPILAYSTILSAPLADYTWEECVALSVDGNPSEECVIKSGGATDNVITYFEIVNDALVHRPDLSIIDFGNGQRDKIVFDDQFQSYTMSRIEFMDVNNDGKDDIVVRAKPVPQVLLNTGTEFVRYDATKYGLDNIVNDTQREFVSLNKYRDHALINDVDGDGIFDLVFGSAGYNAQGTNFVIGVVKGVRDISLND